MKPLHKSCDWSCPLGISREGLYDSQLEGLISSMNHYSCAVNYNTSIFVTVTRIMNTNTTEAIRIAYLFIIKHAFKLFDDESRLSSLQQIVTNLRLTSKDLNNSLCDELSLEIMLRWMKGRTRCARVTQRIEQLLQNNEANSLIKCNDDIYCNYGTNNRSTVMDLVAKIFSKRESVRVLSSFLVTITQHHKHLLKEYMDFFTSRKLHMTIQNYFEQLRDFPFPGFGLEQVEKSLQIANENGWKEESLLLLNLYLQNWPNEVGEHVIEAISTGQKLNFDHKVSNGLKNLYRDREAALYHFRSEYRSWLSLYLKAKEITTSNLMEVLHNVSFGQARDILMVKSNINNKRRCHIISFEGPLITRFFYRLSRCDNFEQSFYSISSPPKIFTGLPPAPEHCQRIYLYHYYRAVVENDIETAKRIHRENNIVLKDFGHHPHPLLEYIKALGRESQLDPMQEMIDYLIENFDGIKRCLTGVSWTKESVARLWPTIRPLINKGAVISNIFIWRQSFFENIPRNVRAFRALLDRSDNHPHLYTQVMDLMLDEFSRTKGIFSEKKLLLLLAWKYDSKYHLSKLPKELLKIIVKFIDEPPLYIQYATISIEDISRTSYSYTTFACILEHNKEFAKFFRDQVNKIDRSALWHLISSYTSEKAIKRDVEYIRELFLKSYPTSIIFPTKMYRYFCKYESDDQLLKQLVEYTCTWTSSDRHYPLLEYAVVGKNTKLLHEFYSLPQNINITLNEEVFASAAPNRKNKISYKEAVALIDEVRSKHRPQLNQIIM